MKQTFQLEIRESQDLAKDSGERQEVEREVKQYGRKFINLKKHKPYKEIKENYKTKMKTKRKGKEKKKKRREEKKTGCTRNRTQDLPHTRPFRCYCATSNTFY